jgi:hypothetical protein
MESFNMEPKQILERFEATPWQKMQKAKELRSFLATLGLTTEDISGTTKEEIVASINEYLAYCRFAIRNNWSPNPKSPSAAKTDKSPDPLPTMAALDDAVSLKTDTQPTDVSMAIRDTVVREGTPPPQADNIQLKPEPVTKEHSSVPPMERFAPLHVTIALNRRLDDLAINHKSLAAAHVEQVHNVSVFTKQVENELQTLDTCTRELQDGFTNGPNGDNGSATRRLSQRTSPPGGPRARGAARSTGRGAVRPRQG